MEKYILTTFENGYERPICYGSSIQGLRETVNNSKGVFDDGYAIYEAVNVEYGTPKNNRLNKQT